MKAWFIGHDVVAFAGVLAGCLLVLQRFTTDRWKHRFRAIRSSALEPRAYRVLFLQVVFGVVLISTLPEAAFVLPALDAVGLDIVTISVALELRYYLTSATQLVGIPTSVDVYLRVPAQLMSRCRDVLRTNPVRWLYACMWLVIWTRTLTMRATPPAQV
jgi:hypothetical protein